MIGAWLCRLLRPPERNQREGDVLFEGLILEAEKRQSLTKKGNGEYREITEGDFLGEATNSKKVICHFYHREFYRCK
ncbi:hypothetical protein HanXRQr2_Chr11g0498231 [Helianthus annuus]|uniref:Uncharacterized protein n=1 Tax=Helianthus annuus TaxID=4232 RepID=A0A9K3HQ39_HELAN|nr:hypothetical protein HanXRQr2_Chr11g0498231 [Helianthus annuus]KAJ0502096.1 putative Thioredoxin-like superfamily [Helianthus annuus]KAJ0518020.1 putative Thioredoxin-like superfamily [Helianthus annuus]KAJ0686040.1 putative Thioredoxin-like superfamily [Helianthus annuus]KAJ0875749.1 hypothetical protein HanPSC8_Chr11g0480191 [Helianthus annuus]